uniref:Uncharacterized protein n=1 Tax=Phytophthora ramorum TaxID=164328 RepID=H3H5B5_PHYRM
MSSQGQPPTTPSASSASSDVPTASATASGTSPTPTSSAPPPATAPPTDNHAAVGPQHVTSGPEYFLRHGNLRGASIYASSAAATSTPPPPGSSPAPSTSAILSQPERDTLRAAADTLDRVMGRLNDQYIAAGTYADLAEDHAVLQARVSELTLELDRVYSSAAPFVCVVEEEISRLRHDRGTLQLALADCQGELAQRLDNRWELDTARTLLDTERHAHADTMSYLHDQIAVLERQVADLETRREIVEVGACRDRVIADLRLARDQHSVADGRRQQLEADVTGLEAAVRRLENDLMDLQRDTDRQLTEMRQRVARSDAEREEFRLRASDASTQFLAAQTQLRQLTAERDRTAISLQHARAQVATSRTTIARLEGQVLQSQGDRNRIQALERQNTALARENMSLTESLNAARTDQAAAIDTRNQAMRECNAIRQRVAALASFSRPSGNPQDHGGPDDDGPEDDDEVPNLPRAASSLLTWSLSPAGHAQAPMSSQGQPPTTPSANSASSDASTASATASGTSPTPTSSAPPPATAPPTDNHAAVGPEHVTPGPEYFLRHGNLHGASIYASSAAASSTPPPPGSSSSIFLSRLRGAGHR